MLRFFKRMAIDATLYQYADGSRDSEGRWVPGTETGSPVRVIPPQPIEADERIPMEDGESIRDFVRLWCDASVAITTRDQKQDADQIEIGTTRYLACQVDHWETQGRFKPIVLKRLP